MKGMRKVQRPRSLKAQLSAPPSLKSQVSAPRSPNKVAIPEHLPPADTGQPITNHYGYLSFDRAFRANLARLTFGLSPVVLAGQTFDWLAHLAVSPGRQLELVEKAFRKATRLGIYSAQCIANPTTPPCIAPLPQDRRFEGQAWQQWPYNLFYQSFLLAQQWWHNATTEIDGVSKRHEESLSFTVRQILDVLSPSNYVWTNPEIAQTTSEQGGRNLVEGFQNFVEDWRRPGSRRLEPIISWSGKMLR
jgi:polyhydroxyalkanoate synthase